MGQAFKKTVCGAVQRFSNDLQTPPQPPDDPEGVPLLGIDIGDPWPYNHTEVSVIDSDGYVPQVQDASGKLELIGATTDTPRVGAVRYGGLKGTIIEETRTNLCLYSENFSIAAWTKADVTPSYNSTAAPDGETTADTLGNNNSIIANVNQTVALEDNEPYAVSVYVKAGTSTAISLLLSGAAVRGQATFQWSAGALTVKSEDVGAAYVRQITSDWWQAVLLVPANTVVAADTNKVFITPTEWLVGGDTKTTIFWGAQVEKGLFATTYIKTTSAAVERAADQLEKTGTSLGGNDTIYAVFEPEFEGADETNQRTVFCTQDAAGEDGTCVYHDPVTKTIAADIDVGGIANTIDSTVAVERGKAYVVGVSVGDTAMPTNTLRLKILDISSGTRKTKGSTGDDPTTNSNIKIGTTDSAGNALCGVIRSLWTFPVQHTDNQMNDVIAWLARRAVVNS